MSRFLTPVIIARGLTYLRELPGNRGRRVNAVQMWTGGETALNLPWCASWLWLVLDIHYQGNPPLVRSASTDDILKQARRERWLMPSPVAGDLFLRLNSPTDAHHVGLVTEVDLTASQRYFQGIAGNTSEDGVSSNGDRVAERWFRKPAPGTVAFVRLPL